MSKEPPLYPSEGSHCFWQAFVFAKYTGDIENGRKKKLKSDKIVLCEDSSFLRTKSPLFSPYMWPRSILAFLFLVIKRYIVDAEEKKGAKLSFYAISLFRISLFEIKCLLVPLPPLVNFSSLRASVSLWMENATLNYRKNNDAKLLFIKSTA